jgi:hypothetical protein
MEVYSFGTYTRVTQHKHVVRSTSELYFNLSLPTGSNERNLTDTNCVPTL